MLIPIPVRASRVNVRATLHQLEWTKVNSAMYYKGDLAKSHIVVILNKDSTAIHDWYGGRLRRRMTVESSCALKHFLWMIHGRLSNEG